MRNKYPGVCYRCDKPVVPGDGHFEWFKGGWRTQHASCAIKFRGMPADTKSEEEHLRKLAVAADGTGRNAQRARRILRDKAS